VSTPRYAQAAAIVRAQVADGTLRPGQPALSGAQLARITGFSPDTCAKALRALITEGTLTRGISPGARPRVAAAGSPPPPDPAGALSRALAALRRKSGLSQPELAALTGYSVTTIGHAETGRLWQSRTFWEQADGVLAADGELTRRYDAYRAAVPADAPAAPAPAPVPRPLLVRMTLHWSDGTTTTARPSP
jgi:Helix-turn-helix domain